MVYTHMVIKWLTFKVCNL